MKTLHLIRHAKSSWDIDGQKDIDRALNKRGRKACEIMAQRIVDAGCNFQNIFCSPAVRAQETIERLAKALAPREINWDVDHELYTFDAGDLLKWLKSIDNTLDELLLVGHNPAITELTNFLGGDLLGNRFIANVPTCGYVQLDLDITAWSEIDSNSGAIKMFLTPKD